MSVHTQQGFTVVEMMVVVAIAALVSAFAIPAFQDMMAKNRANSYAQELTNSMALARNTAISRRRTVLLIPNTTGWELRMDTATGPLIQQHQVKDQSTTFTLSPSDLDEILFDPTGFVKTGPTNFTVTSPLRVTVCDSASKRERGRDITVTRIGRINSVQHLNAAICNP